MTLGISHTFRVRPDTFANVERAEDAVCDHRRCGRVRLSRHQPEPQRTVTVTLDAKFPDQLGAVPFGEPRRTDRGCLPSWSKTFAAMPLVRRACVEEKKMPASSFGKELGTREWAFTSDPVDISVGGNLPAGS